MMILLPGTGSAGKFAAAREQSSRDCAEHRKRLRAEIYGSSERPRELLHGFRVETLEWARSRLELPVELRADIADELGRRYQSDDEKISSLVNRIDASREQHAESAPEDAAPDRVDGDFRAVDLSRIAELERPSSDRDTDRRNAALAKRLRALGEYRRLARLPRAWARRLKQLERRFPNFAPVIRYLGTECFIQARRDGTVRWRPVLIEGPPGIGKTMIAEALCDIFDLGPLGKIDMASSQTSAALTGSDTYWANTRPGLAFELVALGECASRLVLLDELGRSADSQHPPENGLYTLLEPRTAQSFYDLSVPQVRVDASRLLFVATTNDASRIPAPILDRFKRFVIEAPSKAQMRRMILDGWRNFHAELALQSQPVNITEAALDRLSSFPPRVALQEAYEALALAALERRRVVDAANLPLALSRRPAGFVG